MNPINKLIERCKEKPQWTIAFVLSLVYFFLFILISQGKINNELLFGFCVWGAPVEPTETLGCSESPVNSHIIAFGIDVFMTCLAALFYFMDKSNSRDLVIYLAMGFIILGHGLLHWFLQQTQLENFKVDCYNEDLASGLMDIGYTLFSTYSFFLALIIISYGFGGISVSNTLYSIMFAAVVVFLTRNTGGELILPALFCVSHPLACFTGLFTNSTSFHSGVAYCFILCTIVGILELSSCASILKPLGGHFWYDITLHSAVLASLPYFTPPNNIGTLVKKNNKKKKAKSS